MNEKVKKIASDFREVAREAQRYCFLTRDESFQKDSVASLDGFIERVRSDKGEFVSANDDDAANGLLAVELMCRALIMELKMWVQLKERSYGSAWSSLVEAQGNSRRAMQAGTFAGHLEDYYTRLQLLEELLFPPQMFVSPGLVVTRATCSICGEDYNECEHVANRCYCGEMCFRVIEEASIGEVSLVQHPANKNCRALGFPDGGVLRDVMTWMPLSGDPKRLSACVLEGRSLDG